MRAKRDIFSFVLALILVTAPSVADVELAKVFGDHMALQRGSLVPIWGRADPSEEVAVAFRGQTVTTGADGSGRWRVNVLSGRAGGPFQLVVEGKNRIELSDVLVGEVWVCSGQSNMRWSLQGAESGGAEIPKADYPNIRFLDLKGTAYPGDHVFTDEDLANCTTDRYFAGAWAACTPETAKDFSAVAYFFGRELHKALDVPIGLIHNAVGGAPTEAWISRSSLYAHPRFRPMLADWLDNEMNHSWVRERAGKNLAAWVEAAERARSEGKTPPPRPHHPYEPGFLFDAGIAPLIPFAFRGAIWYQGESNGHDPLLHEELFTALTNDWRRAWGQGTFPFLYVQLPGMGTEKGYPAEKWPEFREGQLRALGIPNTAMAVTIDIGHPTDIHPKNKRDVGHRLALAARARVYGEDVVYSGPVFRSMEKESAALRLRFRHVGGGLTARGGGELVGFEVFGEDGTSHTATAETEGGEILVSNPEVPSPVAVRYAWAPFPDCNLVNQEGLPASPFRAVLPGYDWRKGAAAVAKTPARGYTIPMIDLAHEKQRQVVVDKEPGQYLGHPTTVLLEDNKTMIAVYPKGHGGGGIVMKRSADGGLTWSERLPTPENWATSKEAPTLYRVADREGVKRLIMFSGLYPNRMAVSEDDGATWTPLEPIGDFGGIVSMGDLVRLKNGDYMALFHDDGRFLRAGGQRGPLMHVFKTLSHDGGLTWAEPEIVAIRPEAGLCEPGAVRSPDGNQIALLLRENYRKFNSMVIFSDDEGKTWTEPVELPAALTGDRHQARYAPDGRLVVTFRDRAYESPTWGDWVAWIGTYDDIVHGREGQCRVRLMDNTRSADCAYPGIVLLPDGTFVTTTYGHWIEGESPFIVSVRFKLEEIDAKAREMRGARKDG